MFEGSTPVINPANTGGAGGGGGGGISAISASNTEFTSGTVKFTGSNAITVRSTTGQAVVIDAPVHAISNSQASRSGTVNLSGAGIVNVGTETGNAFTISASESVQTQNLHNVTLSGNTAGAMAHISSGTMTLAGGPNITVSQAGNAVSISGGAGGGGAAFTLSGSNTSYSDSAVLSGSGAATVKSTTGQAFVVDVPEQTYATLSKYLPAYGDRSSGFQIGNGTVYVHPIDLPQYLIADRVVEVLTISQSTSTNSSYAANISLAAGIYTQNAGTLSQLTSGSTVYQWTNTSNQSTSVINGVRMVTIPLSISLTPGNYWVGLWSRTSTTNANWATISQYAYSGLNNNFSGHFLSSSHSSYQTLLGQGIMSGSTSTLPNSIGFDTIVATQAWRYVPVYHFQSSTV